MLGNFSAVGLRVAPTDRSAARHDLPVVLHESWELSKETPLTFFDLTGPASSLMGIPMTEARITSLLPGVFSKLWPSTPRMRSSFSPVLVDSPVAGMEGVGESQFSKISEKISNQQNEIRKFLRALEPALEVHSCRVILVFGLTKAPTAR
jgi:hypothetical protein